MPLSVKQHSRNDRISDCHIKITPYLWMDIFESLIDHGIDKHTAIKWIEHIIKPIFIRHIKQIRRTLLGRKNK